MILAAPPMILTTLLLTSVLTSSATGQQEPGRTNDGDTLHVHAVDLFEDARSRAAEENQLLLLKPIYGGCDAAGMLDYRAGTW